MGVGRNEKPARPGKYHSQQSGQGCAHPGAHRQRHHEQLNGVNDGQGRQTRLPIAAHKQAVHNVIKGLDELGQHHRRRHAKQNFGAPLLPQKTARPCEDLPRPPPPVLPLP